MSDQRRHDRSNYRTLVTVLTEDDAGRPVPRVFKAWTEDISASGMQFICNDELPPGRLYVRILLPELEDKIVECDVVRRGRRAATGIIRGSGPRFVYGVRFQSVLLNDQFEAAMAQPQELETVFAHC